MATRQYIGARYVPKFADPILWNSNNIYEPLTMVTYLNNTYTSKKAVPQNIDISNTEYWVLTGNYNAQVEEYRNDTANYINQVTQYRTETQQLATNVENYKSDVTNVNNKIVETNANILILQNTKADKTTVNELSGSVSTQVANINSTLEAQSKRMDTFTSLSSGSTTGDAELMDIRVGANGVTYSSAGTAVRTQVDLLNDSIEYYKTGYGMNALRLPTYYGYSASFGDNWESGGINRTNGNNTADTTSIRTAAGATVSGSCLVLINTNPSIYRVKCYGYSGSSYTSELGWYIGTGRGIIINSALNYRVQINRTDGSDIEMSDALSSVFLFDSAYFRGKPEYAYTGNLLYTLLPLGTGGRSASNFIGASSSDASANYRFSSIYAVTAPYDIRLTVDANTRVSLITYAAGVDFQNGVNTGWFTNQERFIAKGTTFAITVAPLAAYEGDDGEVITNPYISGIFKGITLTERCATNKVSLVTSFVKSVAHQGGNHSGTALNTIPAFKRAGAEGWQFIETDVRWTTDGYPVLSHDDTLTIYGTSNTITVSNSTLSQLRAVQLNAYNEPIAVLWDAMKVCKLYGLKMFIELKDPSTLVRRQSIVEYAKKIGMYKNIFITSFSSGYLLELAQLYTDINILWTAASVIDISDLTTASAYSDIRNILATTSGSVVIAFNYTDTSLNATYIENVGAIGYQVAIYTVDNKANFETYMNLYPDYMVSNNYKVEDLI